MQLDNTARDGETEPRALCARRVGAHTVEAVKDPLNVLFRHANPGVLDADQYGVVDAVERYIDATARRRELDGIVDQIGEQSLDQAYSQPARAPIAAIAEEGRATWAAQRYLAAYGDRLRYVPAWRRRNHRHAATRRMTSTPKATVLASSRGDFITFPSCQRQPRRRAAPTRRPPP